MIEIETPTTVISVRKRNSRVLLADPNFIYVGRRIWHGDALGWPASIWGNPFKPGMTLGQALAIWKAKHRAGVLDRASMELGAGAALHATAADLYDRYVLANPHLRSRLHELRGKTLGCWCGSWKPGELEIGCHAVVLAKLADGPAGVPR